MDHSSRLSPLDNKLIEGDSFIVEPGTAKREPLRGSARSAGDVSNSLQDIVGRYSQEKSHASEIYPENFARILVRTQSRSQECSVTAE
jgi:hypothetical protein